MLTPLSPDLSSLVHLSVSLGGTLASASSGASPLRPGGERGGAAKERVPCPCYSTFIGLGGDFYFTHVKIEAPG